jgi:hypothetical protein
MDIPGEIIIRLGRKHLEQHPHAISLEMGYRDEQWRQARVRVEIKALRCADLSHPMGAWWIVEGKELTPVPTCLRCGGGDVDYSRTVWTDMKGVV